MDFAEFEANVGVVFDAMEREREPIVVERGGRLYRVEPQDREETQDIWANYDVERVRQALRLSRGALTGVDRATLLADIHAQRGQDSSGRPAE